MPFKDSSQSSFQPAAPNLVGEIIDVNVDVQNPMQSTITVRANPTDNLNLYEGDYTLMMDTSKSPSQRYQIWQHARAEGNGFCGALITQDTERRKGEKMLFEGVRFNGERSATTSWLRSYSNQRRRSPGLLKTLEVEATNPYTSERYKAIKLVSVACQEGDAFALSDDERWNALKARADKNYNLGTKPIDFQTDRGQLFLRTSMPATAATFALLDHESGELLEYSTFDSKILPNPADYPEHYTDRDKRTSNNQPSRVPRDGENYEKMRRAYMNHIDSNYPGRVVTPICIEFTEYRVTTKTQKQRDLESPKEIKEGSHANPLQDFHEANLVKFRDDVSLQDSFSRGSYHPDICIQKAPNAARTFSMYVRPEYDFQPPEFKHKPWLSFVLYNGEPLKLPAEMVTPYDLQGNVLASAAQQANPSAPAMSGVQGSNAVPQQPQRGVEPAAHPAQPLGQRSQVSEANSGPRNEPLREPPVQQQPHSSQPTSSASYQEPQTDPAFEDADGLETEEQEAQRLHQMMQQHEMEAAGVASAEEGYPSQGEAPAEPKEVPQQQAEPGNTPPLPDTDQYQQFANQFEHTEHDCPFKNM